jgi:hypothetical protein
MRQLEHPALRANGRADDVIVAAVHQHLHHVLPPLLLTTGGRGGGGGGGGILQDGEVPADDGLEAGEGGAKEVLQRPLRLHVLVAVDPLVTSQCVSEGVGGSVSQ